MVRRMVCRWLMSVLLVISVSVRADDSVVLLRRFANTDFLRDDVTLSALRDKYGFLWVGTSTGLYCFDGNGTQINNDMRTTLRPAETRNIGILYEYGDDMWFGSSSGLYVFNRKSNTFAPLPYRTKYGVKVSSAVQRILTAGNGFIWLGTHGQGLFVLNASDKTLTQDSRHGTFISDMAVGNDGLVYTITLDGNISVFNPDGSFVYRCQLPEYIPDKSKICMISFGTEIWIASSTCLYCLHTSTRSVEHKKNVVAPAVVNCLLTGDRDNVLLGTTDGIWRYNIGSGAMSRLDSTGAYDYGLLDHNVGNLYRDIDGSLIVVIPTYGVFYIPWQSEAFRFMSLPTSMMDGSCSFVRTLFPSADGKGVWVGTDYGLGYYDNATGELQKVALGGVNDEITSITADGALLWIGMRHSGLCLLDPTKPWTAKSFTYDSSTPYSVISNEINGIYRTSHGEIFVLTSWGLCRFDPKNESFMTYPNLGLQTSFICMQEDSLGRLWAATENNGLYMRQRADGILEHISMDGIDMLPITAMHLDSSGVLWVAVRDGGVFYYDEDASMFRPLEAFVLQGKTALFMEEDHRGFLWVGLQDILVRVSIGDGSNDIRLYTYNRNINFLPVKGSSCSLDNGNILFGSSNGFFTFDPKQMKSNDSLVNVYVRTLSFPNLDNSDEELDRLGLNVLLYMQDGITLPYSDNTFTIQLSASRYGDMPPVRYNCMLCGVDKDWIKGIASSEITYNGLNPGTYEFLVDNSTGSGNQISSLRIVILPPWYRAVWAYLLYIFIALIVAWCIFLLSRRMLRNRYDRNMREYRERKDKEIFTDKIRFFVNLVHEIRTPLTLMSLPMERMADEIDAANALPTSEMKRHIQSMRSNMNYLLGIINQILDIHRMENNREVNLHLQRGCVNKLLRDICGLFEHPMAVEGKEIVLDLPEDDVCATFDVDKVQKVVMNLVANARKYSKHRIGISLTSDDGLFSIVVADDGSGIPVAERDRIFDVYYQIGNDNVASSFGTGIGLAYAKTLATAHGGIITVGDSETGGAQFTLSLPVGDEKTDGGCTEWMRNDAVGDEVQNVPDYPPHHTTSACCLWKTTKNCWT